MTLTISKLIPGALYSTKYTRLVFTPFDAIKKPNNILMPKNTILLYLFNERIGGYNNLHFLYQANIWRIIFHDEDDIDLVLSKVHAIWY